MLLNVGTAPGRWVMLHAPRQLCLQWQILPMCMCFLVTGWPTSNPSLHTNVSPRRPASSPEPPPPESPEVTDQEPSRGRAGALPPLPESSKTPPREILAHPTGVLLSAEDQKGRVGPRHTSCISWPRPELGTRVGMPGVSVPAYRTLSFSFCISVPYLSTDLPSIIYLSTFLIKSLIDLKGPLPAPHRRRDSSHKTLPL